LTDRQTDRHETKVTFDLTFSLALILSTFSAKKKKASFLLMFWMKQGNPFLSNQLLTIA
jgi:hypothetical protein